MKAIRNKLTTVCACSVIPGYQKRGKKKYKLTQDDCEKIDTFEGTLAQYCLLDRNGACDESVHGSHTTVGVKHHSYCRICGLTKWEVIAHPPLQGDFPREADRSGGSNLLRLPAPELRIPNAEYITAENQAMQDRDYDD